MVADMVTELVEGLVFVAASNLHWGGRRWWHPNVSNACFDYQIAYQVKHQRPIHVRKYGAV